MSNSASPAHHSASVRLIGAHVSAAGGVDKAVERAAEIGATCVQVFSGSPRVWARAPLTKVDPKEMFSKMEKLAVNQVFTHALYLTNVGSSNPELVRKSIAALQYDLKFDSLVKGSGVVVHLGSHLGQGWEAVREGVAAAISEILADTSSDSHLLIENSAGQQGKLCSDLSEIRWLLDTVKSPRLKWCFDTCHGFASGLALGKVHPDQGRTAAEVITEHNLWPSLQVIHVNDSRDPFGSGRDRHANLGDGEIPPADLKYFLTLPETKGLPLVLEVPGLDGNGPDAANIERLKSLAN